MDKREKKIDCEDVKRTELD